MTKIKSVYGAAEADPLQNLAGRDFFRNL